jgi:hypothetical protein
LPDSKRQQQRSSSQAQSLDYADIEEIVEYLVKVKAPVHTFDCFSEDDIGQEIRLICFKALNHFDMSRVKQDKLVNFFGRCVDNALKNLKRDNYIRFSSPCNSDCEFLHSEDDGDTLAQVCRKWLKFHKGQQAKKLIKHPVSIEATNVDLKDSRFEEMVEVEDIKKYLMENIEDELRPALITILEGNIDDVPIRERRLVQISIKNILKD